MPDLQSLLQRAWQVRQAHFPSVLGVDIPRRTRSLSLTGSRCALDCAHCGTHYLERMLSLVDLRPDDPRLEGVDSLLISGGCDRQGRVPVQAHLDRVRALAAGRRLVWHVGLIGEEEVEAIADLVDAVSFDLVGDEATIAEVYGIEAPVEQYRQTYRLLRQRFPTIPHVTIGLRGGRLSGEEAVLDLLQEEGAEAIVFLVLIPTPDTRYAECTPPPLDEVAALLAEARLRFPSTPLLLGCMRPGGHYRRRLDRLAVQAGINRIVNPHPTALESAAERGLRLEESESCCVLALPAVQGRPAEVRVSAGTEVVLNLRRRPMDAAPTTAYLMIDGGGCAMACAFCAQARDSRARADALSRIVWPEHSTDAVLAHLEQAPPSLRRVCVQVTLHHGALAEVTALVRDLARHSDRPVSVAVRPPNVEAIADLLQAGADAVGLGLDAACERVYRAVKGAGWGTMVALIEQAARRFPGRIRVHLMVGLGESERELCRTMQWIYDQGGTVGLFAFTPVRGTPLEDRSQPPLAAYRRMQAARRLIDRGWSRCESFTFDRQGRLASFGRSDVADLLADGEAFRTSGCPGCNRPFYNERPGGVIYNYPYPLEPQEAAAAIAAMGLPDPTGAE